MVGLPLAVAVPGAALVLLVVPALGADDFPADPALPADDFLADPALPADDFPADPADVALPADFFAAALPALPLLLACFAPVPSLFSTEYVAVRPAALAGAAHTPSPTLAVLTARTAMAALLATVGRAGAASSSAAAPTEAPSKVMISTPQGSHPVTERDRSAGLVPFCTLRNHAITAS
jgi:hypothetical protein